MSPAPAGVPPWLRPLVEALPGIRPEQLSRFQPPPGGGRHSAVLVLFGEAERGPDVLLIQRAATLRSHAGQPAFPGGALDPEDGSVDDDGHVRGALREAAEEVGLDPATVEVLGVLPPLWLPPSGFVVHPVLAWWREPHDVRAVDTAEVSSVVRVPLEDLVDPANRLQITHPSGWLGPAFDLRGSPADMLVWGFTAGLLDRLLDVGGWARPWDTGRREQLDAETLAMALRSSPARRVPPDTLPPAQADAVTDAEATGAG